MRFTSRHSAIRRLIFALGSLIILTASGCASDPVIATEEIALPITEPTRSDTQRPAASETPNLTGTPSPTISPSPTTISSPTHTHTPSPTAEPLVAEVAVSHAVLFSGPGFNYNFVAQFPLGFKLEVIGRSENDGWIVVQFAGGAVGWVPIEAIVLQIEPGPLVVFEPPPLPPPSATPAPVPMVVLNPPSGPPGLNFYMTYSGFTPHVSVSLVVTQVSTGMVVYESGLHSVGGNGTNAVQFRGTIRIEPGEYIFTVTGVDGKSASARLTIIGPNE